MKKLSKQSKLVLGIVAVILLFFGYYSYLTHLWEQNVFDQMYYRRIHKSTELDWIIDYRRLFKDTPQLHTPQRNEDNLNIWMGNMVFENYKNSYMEDGHMIIFKFQVNAPIMSITYRMDAEDDREWYSYRYDVDQKTLTYDTSAPENTEMKNFLFDRVLPDWFAANKWKTRFSSENLGKYTLIDPTVKVQYENYSIEEKQISFDDVHISYPVFVSDGSPFEDAVNALLLEELCLGQDEEELRNYKDCQIFDGSYSITFANEDMVSICLHIYAVQGGVHVIEEWLGVTFSISEQRVLCLSDICTWEDLVQLFLGHTLKE